MATLQDAHLVLFFTRGISLKTWDHIGLLDREVALYEAMRPCLGKITFVTYGDARDLRYADRVNGIRIVCNRWRLPQQLYVKLLSRLYPRHWKGCVVLKSNQVQGADIALQVARRFRNKFVARCGYLHSDVIEHRHGSNSDQARRARALEKKVFDGADRVVVTTPVMRERVLQRYRLPEERVVVIPNYVDTEVFRPGSDRYRLPKRICYVGRLGEEKNLFGLLEAVKGLEVELVIVGGGPLSIKLRKEAALHKLPVRLMGNVPNRKLPEILNSAALFILPSYYEGHPKALLEAMACGLPVIGTDVSGIRELISHRETGYLCGTSSEEIRQAIQEVLSDLQLRTRMGRNARDFIINNFTLERVSKMELALLEELLKE